MAEYCYTVSGNKPPSNRFCLVGFAGTLNLLTRFAVIVSSHRILYIFMLYHLIFMSGNCILSYRKNLTAIQVSLISKIFTAEEV